MNQISIWYEISRKISSWNIHVVLFNTILHNCFCVHELSLRLAMEYLRMEGLMVAYNTILFLQTLLIAAKNGIFGKQPLISVHAAKGVLTTGSAQTRPSAQPPIDMT